MKKTIINISKNYFINNKNDDKLAFGICQGSGINGLAYQQLLRDEWKDNKWPTMEQKQKLTQRFFNRHVAEVAKDLLGKILVFNGFKGIITETEAYRGQDDEASHAFKGSTPRSYIMFGEAAYSYVYLIYGMYYCLNIVTEGIGQPSAVLIRGLKLPDIHLNGPGKICKYLGITKEHNAVNLAASRDFYLTEGVNITDYQATPRIGIKKSTDKLWRFVCL